MPCSDVRYQPVVGAVKVLRSRRLSQARIGKKRCQRLRNSACSRVGLSTVIRQRPGYWRAVGPYTRSADGFLMPSSFQFLQHHS